MISANTLALSLSSGLLFSLFVALVGRIFQFITNFFIQLTEYSLILLRTDRTFLVRFGGLSGSFVMGILARLRLATKLA